MNTNRFVANLWVQLEVTPKTRRNYIGTYLRNLDPFIGKKPICEVKKQDLIDALSVLPAQTRYQAYMVARVIFREAILRELIANSPVSDLKAPRVLVKPQKFLTWEELKNIDFGYQTKRVHFLALHGLRYGEAAALTADDVIDGRVNISKSKYGPTKTKSGVRQVPLMSEFVNFPLYQDGIAKALKPYGVTVHSLRKTYAYLLKQSNVHVTTAAKLLGHSNPMVTLKVYTQVLDNEIEKTGEALNQFMKAS